MARCRGVIMRKEKVGINLYRITRTRCSSEEALHGWCMIHYFKYTGQSSHKDKRVDSEVGHLSPLFQPHNKNG